MVSPPRVSSRGPVPVLVELTEFGECGRLRDTCVEEAQASERRRECEAVRADPRGDFKSLLAKPVVVVPAIRVRHHDERQSFMVRATSECKFFKIRETIKAPAKKDATTRSRNRDSRQLIHS